LVESIDSVTNVNAVISGAGRFGVIDHLDIPLDKKINQNVCIAFTVCRNLETETQYEVSLARWMLVVTGS
jgi:hypothetical protein